jgi:pectate lyase
MNGGTTGGAGGTTVTVSTGKELIDAIANAGSQPLTVLVDGEITTSNTGADAISLDNVHNVSIIGAGGGAEFDGIGFQVKGGSSNLIFQNLSIHDVNSGPKDAIGMEGGAHNIWIDHNEFYSSMSVGKDYYDGAVDTKRGVEYVTISNNNFHDHHKVSLNGYTDGDEGGRYVTYDHNIFNNIGSRAPLVRDGEVHVYDNYYKDVSESAVNIRMGAEALVENNVFENVKNPIVSIDSDKVGYWNLSGNEFTNVSWGDVGSGEASAQDGQSTSSFTAPYDYKLDDTSSVKAYVTAHAGVGKLDVPDSATGTVVTAPADNSSEDKPSSGSDVSSGEDQPSSGTDTASGEEQPSSGTDTTSGNHDALSIAATSHADDLVGTSGADAIDGLGGKDTISSGAGDDTLSGGTNIDTLSGEEGKDTLAGGTGNDVLTGGLDADILTGGDGRDHFVFTSIEDSASGSARDVITDFGSRDSIDLSAIDAQSDESGDQGFTFIGGEDFGGHAGELHVVAEGEYSLVEGDVDGDGSADFQIALTGRPELAASDFAL